MASNLQSLFQKIKIDVHTANFVYIYYDRVEGSIHKISPRREETAYEILEVDHDTAYPFLTGEKKTSDYRISYDVANKTVALKNINERNPLGTYDKILYQIPMNNGSADLTIEQDFNTNSWNVSISIDTLDFVKNHSLSLYDKILLSITAKDDPNILYRTLYVDLGTLAEQTISIPFRFEFERTGKHVSIYTNKYFDSYSYKVTECQQNLNQ